MDFTDKSSLLMYGSNYPHWSATTPGSAAAGLNDVQREKVLWRNAAELYTIAEREGSRL